MKNVRLKLFGTTYNAKAQITSFKICIGRSILGNVTREGSVFRGRIGLATAKGPTAENAARATWHAFCDWDGPVYGLHKPGSVELEQDRVTLRTVGKSGFDILIGGEAKGEVVRLGDGRFKAMIQGVEKVGCCAMASARLCWIKKVEG